MIICLKMFDWRKGIRINAENRMSYARILEIAQKVMEGGVATWITLCVTLRWLKVRIIFASDPSFKNTHVIHIQGINRAARINWKRTLNELDKLFSKLIVMPHDIMRQIQRVQSNSFSLLQLISMQLTDKTPSVVLLFIQAS